ncbi:hypothetical protein GF373_12025 [bacterium]|nr:hypothetical protein [bacterium]
MKNEKNRKKSIIYLGDDLEFVEKYKKIVRNDFGIQFISFKQDDIREALRVSFPILMILDFPAKPDPRTSIINWLRDHFHGRPIVALLDCPTDEGIQKIRHRGVNLILDKNSPDFPIALREFIQAMDSDQAMKYASK